MLIVPLSHEQSVARRWPWITTVIILLNVCTFLGYLGSDQRASEELERRVADALEYYSEHPGLELGPPLSEMLPELAQAAQAQADESQAAGAQVQAEFDEHLQEIDAARQALSAWSFGYQPVRGELSSLFTHQFLHGGVLHLLFNMWFLWLVGCNVEDAWGRLVFPAFYLSAGAFAGLVHGWMTSEGSVLIGASGAVAAAMGAFLVGYAQTKIRFLAIFWIRPVTFSARAYVMLPLWVAVEVLWGLTRAGSGVAHWAHVGGFGFGLAIALGLRWSGLDQRIEAGIEEGDEVFSVDPELAKASALLDAGDVNAATPLLEQLAAGRSATALVFVELLRAKQAVGDAEGARRTKLRLLEWHLQKQQADEAIGVFEELRNEDSSEIVPPGLRLRLARQYRRRSDVERAALAFAEIHSAPERSEHSLPALLGHAELLLEQGQLQAARELYERAQSFVSTDVQVDAAIRQGLARTLQAARPSTSPPPP